MSTEASPTESAASRGVTDTGVIPAVLSIDDHELIRFATKTLLKQVQPNWEMLEATTLTAGMEIYAVNEGRIGLTILDMNLPDSNGLSALRQFRRRFPRAEVAVLSGVADQTVIEEAIGLGAVGYIAKGSDLAALESFLVSLSDPHGRSERSLAMPKPQQGISVLTLTDRRMPKRMLTQRETQVLDLLLAGCSNADIAQSCGLTLGTVKNYVSALLVLFGVKSRAQLLAIFR